LPFEKETENRPLSPPLGLYHKKKTGPSARKVQRGLFLIHRHLQTSEDFQIILTLICNCIDCDDFFCFIDFVKDQIFFQYKYFKALPAQDHVAGIYAGIRIFRKYGNFPLYSV
jgi:hypothetical protein